ncbi:alpha/beta fold hydrolase [Chitinophaga silvatica]|uniref:Alpha/beta fold hydrolase n=1 Tax=Chitinophaga silvatica TaxID=2282649 RepID=A0A3E1Y969_9BACT|nr:alpha/beta fold hydrolase [Chitinophaga silvatica]RFS21999.1 alpha/beta fold hydrolase [Chitinophaga silvatica]
MKSVLLLLGILWSCISITYSQPKATIIPGACPVVIDSSVKTRCGYLVVPENRKKNNGKTIQLPFIIVESPNPDKKKDPLLFTAGGPGSSSLGWARGAAKSMIIKERDCIAFEQRGAWFAKPNLNTTDLDSAMKLAYRKNLNKDSMMLEGVKRYKKNLEAKGIDLTGYNTDETVADIHDLLSCLNIDSVNLFGVSYSGGLMLAVLQHDPARIRSLILDSPLPAFIHIDEDEPANFNEALSVLFSNCERDSVDKIRYSNLREKFQRYFTGISDKVFTLPYLEKGTKDTINIQYTKNDLLDIIQNYLSGSLTEAPFVITELINGNHYAYMKKLLDDLFAHGRGPSGMRMSVYCADQAAYNSLATINSISAAYPYMKGYHINDVYKAICDCWTYKPINATTKQPFYSNKPALLADGEMDPACRPVYIDLIHHYLPNSSRLLFKDRGHGVGGRDFQYFMLQFLNHPFEKVVSDNSNIISY